MRKINKTFSFPLACFTHVSYLIWTWNSSMWFNTSKWSKHNSSTRKRRRKSRDNFPLFFDALQKWGKRPLYSVKWCRMILLSVCVYSLSLSHMLDWACEILKEMKRFSHANIIGVVGHRKKNENFSFFFPFHVSTSLFSSRTAARTPLYLH